MRGGRGGEEERRRGGGGVRRRRKVNLAVICNIKEGLGDERRFQH